MESNVRMKNIFQWIKEGLENKDSENLPGITWEKGQQTEKRWGYVFHKILRLVNSDQPDARR